MRYASDNFGHPPIGVEPQPRGNPLISTVEIVDYSHQNIITVTDNAQLQELVNLLRDASRINGWGGIK